MTNIKSAQKRVLIAKRNEIRNRKYKSMVKTYTKKYFVLIENHRTNPTQENLKLITHAEGVVFSKIDKAVKKNIFHKNTAARKKSQISMVIKKDLI